MAEQKSQHSCLRRFDEFMYCMTVTSQCTAYYHSGMYNDCSLHFQRWQTCLRSRLKKPKEADEMLLAERQASQQGTHLFLFRPEYADEAQKRYGVEARTPQEQDSTLLNGQ